MGGRGAADSSMMETSHAEADAIAAALTNAWNSYDGDAFAEQFAEDADFVNIFGMHGVGRQAIARAHQAIFDGIYRGSVNKFTVAKVRPIGPEALIAHINAELSVPQGPMAGLLRAIALAVLVRENGTLKIVSFHNTREQAPPASGLPS